MLRSGFGSLSIGGLFQGSFIYYLGQEDPAFDVDPDGSLKDVVAEDIGKEYEFTLNRLRLRVAGSILADRVSIFASSEFARQEASLLDMILEFNYLPYTAIRIGRFVPELTFFGPLEPENLLLIDYPQMDEDRFGSAMHNFRQVGLEIKAVLPYLTANLGLFNGWDAELFNDNNTAKDVFVCLTVTPPVRGLKAKVAFYYSLILDTEQSRFDGDGEFREENNAAQIFTAGIWYLPNFGPIAVVEGAYRTVYPADENLEDRVSLSYYAMLGFDFWRFTGLPIQLLARYDRTDPNMDKDRDDYTVITGGLNYSLEREHARISVNYLRRTEAFEVEGVKGLSQEGFADDLVKLQAQVAF